MHKKNFFFLKHLKSIAYNFYSTIQLKSTFYRYFVYALQTSRAPVSQYNISKNSLPRMEGVWKMARSERVVTRKCTQEVTLLTTGCLGGGTSRVLSCNGAGRNQAKDVRRGYASSHLRRLILANNNKKKHV